MNIFRHAIENGKTMAVAGWGTIFGRAIYDCGREVFASTDVIECILKTEMQRMGFYKKKSQEENKDGGAE